jgi:hypothetical protein
VLRFKKHALDHNTLRPVTITGNLDDFAPVPRQRHHSDKTIAAELPLMVTFQMV